jgi:hypothetical protein
MNTTEHGCVVDSATITQTQGNFIPVLSSRPKQAYEQSGGISHDPATSRAIRCDIWMTDLEGTAFSRQALPATELVRTTGAFTLACTGTPAHAERGRPYGSRD